jgi:microcin C transport system substrate-binding protein
VLVAALTIGAGVLAGCGGGGGDRKAQGSGAVTMPKAVKVAPGADPSVPAEMGGAGFEAIAKDSGWSDGRNVSEADLALMADPNAKKGGELRTLIGDFPATFRTMGKDANTATTQLVYSLVYESLIGINPLNLEFLPGLASHWRVDLADSQTYWFRINPDARFSDGHPVTTADVLETWRVGADSTILDPFQNTFQAEFEQPVAVSKYLLKVRSKRNNWKNMLYFGGQAVYPAHALKGLTGSEFLKKFQTTMPPGSGPYVMLPEGLRKQQSITLTRLADWWQKDDPYNVGTYNFDRIRLLFVEDDNLQYNKFLNGDADVISVRSSWWVQKFNLDEVRRGLIEKRKIFNNQPTGLVGVAFNMRREPFNDPRVRLAVIHLINREEIIKNVLFNELTISDSYFENSPYKNASNPKYRYDPQRAQQLLAEAGYTSRNQEGVLVKKGRPFVIEMPIDKGTENILVPIQRTLGQAGIKVNFREVDFAQKVKIMDERSFTMLLASYTGIIFPNPEGSWHSSLADKTHNNNLTGFKNARADEIIMEEKVTHDPQRRVQLLQELDGIFMAENPYALLWYAPFSRLVVWKHIQAPKFGLGRISDARGIYGLWWYDAEIKEQVEKAKKDKSNKLPVPPVDNKFWLEWGAQRAGQPTASR